MAGLVIRDRNSGRVKLDSSTGPGNILGILTVGGAGFPQSGSINVPGFSLGKPFFFVTANTIFITRQDTLCKFKIDGENLSWFYPIADSTYASQRPDARVLYGFT